jgi:hypothetical protein
MAGSDPKIQLDITAKDNASDKIDDVADAAAKLEKLTPEVQVDADTDAAKADLDAVADQAAKLDRADATLVIKAQIDAAEADLRRLKGELASLDDTAASTGRKIGDEIESGTSKAGGAVHSMAGNVIGDSAAMATGFGPLGEAVGQLTEGLLGGEVAMKQLLSAGLAMGGIALVAKTVTDALAETKAVDAFNKKKVEDFVSALREGKTVIDSINDAFAETGKIEFADQVTGKTKDLVGDLAAAGVTFDEFLSKVALGKDGFKAWVIELGSGVDPLTNMNGLIQAGNQFIDDRAAAEKAWSDQMFVTGQTADETDRETRKLNATFEQGTDSIDHNTAAAKRATTQIDKLAENTAKADGAHRRLIDGLDERQAWTNVNKAMDDYAEKTKHSADETDDMIRTIADYVDETDTIPATKKTEIFAALDQGDVAEANRQIDELTRQRDLKILLTAVGSADTIKLLRGGGRGGTGIVDESLFAAPAAGAVNNIYMPRGARGVDVVRQISGSARRSGRRYGAQVVTHARR